MTRMTPFLLNSLVRARIVRMVKASLSRHPRHPRRLIPSTERYFEAPKDDGSARPAAEQTGLEEERDRAHVTAFECIVELGRSGA